MRKGLYAVFLLCCLFFCGCGKKEEPSKETSLPHQEISQETKSLAPGKGKQGVRVEFVTRQHRMERIVFSGGYLRNLPEEKPGTIMRPAPAGSQGMIFGKRELGGLEWAKVATRDGVTAWYTVPARAGAAKNEKRPSLQVTDVVYESVYPQVTGGAEAPVQERINQELGNYFSVYRHVTGPVGGEVRCSVMYNRNGLLSLVFQGKPVLFRSYPVSEINNLPSWAHMKKYAFISPLMGGADDSLLTAEKTDFQYAMTFDLHTGKRLDCYYFLGSDKENAVRERTEELGRDARLQPDNFYVNENGQLTALVDVTEPEPGRMALDLTDLVSREF